MSSEHDERTYPVQAFIFATVLAGLIYALVAALNDFNEALFALPLIVGWAWVSLLIFGKPDPATHAEAPASH